MDQTIVFSFASSLIGGLVVAAANHFMTKRRDREQRKREMVTKFLIDAWQNLGAGSRDETAIHTKSKALEKAIADIQLFGSPEQIKLAKNFSIEMVQNNSGASTELLSDLQKRSLGSIGLTEVTCAAIFLQGNTESSKNTNRSNRDQICSRGS